MSTGGPLSFNATLTDADFMRSLDRIEKRLITVTKATEKETSQLDDMFSQLGRSAAGAFAFVGLAQLPAQIVRVRGEFQQLEIAFTTMLQSKERADKLMQQVANFASQTPYGLKDTAAATKQLLAFGESADTVVDTLRRLGDIASGIGAPLGDIAYLYGTTMTQGQLYAEDLNQFTGRGIPMIKELANVLGVAENQVKKMVSEGKVGFPEVQKAIQNLTKEGSMFGGLMEAQSKSLIGLQAALGDAVDGMLNNIGKSQEGILTSLFQGTITLVENYEKVIDVLKIVVATYGAYRAALLLTAAAQSASVIATQAAMWLDLARSVKSAKDAHILFNLAAKANPYVLIGTALAGLIASYVVFSDKTEELTAQQKELQDGMKRVEEGMASETAKVKVLTTTINNEKASRDERNKALQELISLSPTHLNALNLENVKTAEGTAAINSYIEAKKKQLELKEIESQLESSIKRQQAAEKGENQISTWDRAMISFASAGSYGNIDYFKETGKAQKKLNDDIVKSEEEVQKKLKERIEGLSSSNAATKQELIKTVGWYDEQIKGLTSKLSGASTKAEHDRIKKEIEALERQKAGITGGKTTSRASEVKKEAEIEKQTRIVTFQEEIEEKKKLYELYDRWVANYGKNAADEQFSDLVSNQKSYLDWLNYEIKRLETEANTGYTGGLSATDKSNLDKLIDERGALSGQKSSLDLFNQQLDTIRDSSASLTDELIALAGVWDTLDKNDTTAAGFAKRQALIEREIETQKERKQLLAQFLVDVAGSEQQQAAIQKHYADLRAELDNQYNDKKSEAYQKALEAINKTEADELNKISNEVVKASKAYKELERAASLVNASDTKERIAAEKKLLKLLTVGTDEYLEQLERVNRAEKEHQKSSMAMWSSIGMMVADLGGALSQYEGLLGEIGGTLSGLGNAAAQVSNTFKNMDSYVSKGGGLTADGYAAAAQGVIQIIGGIIEANQRRIQQERQFAAERLGFENDYQLALIQSTGLNYGNNPFYTDYEGKIKAGVDQYKLALDSYMKAIDKLEEGKAKERQKNALDGKTTLGMVGAGAASGALIGGAIGAGVFSPVTAAIGAVVGGVVGLIGGLFSKKKKDVYGSLVDMYPELVQETAEGWAELNVEMANALITNNQVDDKTKELLENAIALNEEMEKAKLQIQDTVTELTGQIGDNLRNALVEAFRAGDSAAQALHKTVGNIISDVATKLLFSSLVGPVLDQLVDEMTSSLTSGDGTVVDDLVRFDKYGLPAVESYFDGLEQLDKWAKQNGFDNILGRDTGETEQSAGATQGTIQGMSEETASILIGQFNALRIHAADMAGNMRISVLHLATIAANTAYNRYLVKLEDIDNTLVEMKAQNNGRGLGL